MLIRHRTSQALAEVDPSLGHRLITQGMWEDAAATQAPKPATRRTRRAPQTETPTEE